MRVTTLAVLVLAAASSAACRSHEGGESEGGDGDERELDVRDVVGDARVTLRQAVDAALAARPGDAIEAELEGEEEGGRREIEWEVAILDAEGTLWDVSVDAATGQVVEVERADDRDDVEEAAEILEALGANHLRLADLVDRAGTSHGTAVEAEFDEDEPEAEVVFVRGRELVEVDLDARTGEVRGAKTK